MTSSPVSLLRAVFALGATVLASASLSALVDVSLPGATQYDGWSGLNGSNYGAPLWPDTFGGFAAPWGAPVVANEAGSSGATFLKLGGGGYFAGQTIYSFEVPGTFLVSQSAPLAGLETVVFQLEAVGGLAAAPSLSFNGGTQSLPADFSAVTPGTVNIPGFGDTAVFQYQWDLSGLGEAVSSYDIVFTGAPHLSQFALQLDAGGTFAAVIPEPSALVLAGGSLLLLGLMMRRRA